MLKLSFLFLTVVTGVLCLLNDLIEPCEKHDFNCMTQAAKKLLPKVAVGIPSLGIESIDPLHLTDVEGNLSDLKYTLSHSVVTGIKNCDIDNVRLHTEQLSGSFNLSCRDIAHQGKYNINGKLFILPIQGNGDFKTLFKKYEIGLEVQLKKKKNRDGTEYVAIEKYKYDAVPQEGATYEFKNLFNGQKILADPVLAYMNSNWKEVTDYLQGPILDIMCKKLAASINKFLKTIPIEEIVL